MKYKLHELIFLSMVLMLLMSVVFASKIIVNRQNALQNASLYNISWWASQALVEFTRLEQRISAFGLPDSGVGKDDVELRFDILVGRVASFAGGQFQDFLRRHPEHRETLDQLTAAVAAAEPLIQQIERPGTIQRLLAILLPLDLQLASLASSANQYGAELVAEDQSGLMRLHLIFSALAGGLALLGLALIAFLSWQNRTLERAREDQDRSATAAREAHRRLETTLENMDQGLLMYDANGIIRIYNRKVLELLDLPEELLASQPSFQKVRQYQMDHGEFVRSDERFRQWVAESGVEETPDAYERERPNGTVLEVRTVPLPDGGAVRTFTDITAHRKAETELRESEERYRLVSRATNDAIWDWDLLSDKVVWTDAIETLFGYKLEDVEPSASWWSERIHPDDRERVVGSVQALINAGGLHFSAEYCFRKADGSYANVLDRGFVMRDLEGRPVRMVGAMLDQTESRRREVEIRETNATLSALISASPIGIVSIKTDLMIEIWNPAAERIFGYAAEEMIGRRYDFLVPEGQTEVFQSYLERLKRGEVLYNNTVQRRRRDGSLVEVSASGAGLFTATGELRGAVITLEDVTKRSLLEEQLRQSQKMEAVGQLTGGIAHDFNNLLTVILGNAELLTESSSNPALVQTLSQMILDAAERGADLTQHLLAFGRRQSLKPVRVSLDHVVQGMTPLLQRTIGAHIELRTDLAHSLNLALTDRTLLESAILNLVVNARDAMPQGGTLTITTGEGVAGPGQGQLPIGQDVVSVTVSDTGTGMVPEVLERVFEPFYTTKEVGKGSGLGLSMVYGFAQQSGGHVSIISKEGQGTSVTILLPAVYNRSLQHPDKDERASAPVVGRERILLVEDEPQVQQFVSAQLISLGYGVTAVSTGPDALSLLQEDPWYDLLFTDVVLPKGMSGVELARRARQIRPELKVLLTSGYSQEVFEQHGRPDEDILLLRKPYKRKELAEVLRRVLEPSTS